MCAVPRDVSERLPECSSQKDVKGAYRLSFLQENPEIIYISLVLVTLVAAPFLQRLIGTILLRLTIQREDTIVDDLIVDALRPYRFVYSLPWGLAFFLSDWLPNYGYEARLVSGLALIIVATETGIKVLSAAAAVIRHRAGAKGASSTGFIDLFKVLLVLFAIAFAAAITIDTDLITLLGGLGAATAVAGFIFKDTLHSIFASTQIASWGLIKEGEWFEFPAFKADGIVEHIGLYHIKIRNWDMTTALVPTHKALEVASTNYASMQGEARARRIQATFWFDVTSVRLCDRELLFRLRKIPLIADAVEAKIVALGEKDSPGHDPDLSTEVATNFELFAVYVEQYLRQHKDLFTKERPTSNVVLQLSEFVLVRTLAPTEHGVPLEIFASSRQVDLIRFSKVQSEIFNHMLSMISLFDLRLHQTAMEH